MEGTDQLIVLIDMRTENVASATRDGRFLYFFCHIFRVFDTMRYRDQKRFFVYRQFTFVGGNRFASRGLNIF